jgi:PAS domain S-box-containing protein
MAAAQQRPELPLSRTIEGMQNRIQSLEVSQGELRKAQEALSESQRKLFTLMANLPGMAYRCLNDQNWTMEFVSEGCLALTGFAPSDLIGNRTLSYDNLVHPEDRERVWDRIQAALRQKAAFRLEYRIRHASGQLRWVWEQGVGVFAEDGELLVLEGFITDITDRKRAEEELVKAQEQLEHRVQKRTAELAAANAQLQREVDERRQAEAAVRGEQQLLHRLLELHEQERQMVAYDIHDGFAQHVGGAAFRFHAFRQLFRESPEEAWREFDAGMSLLDQSLLEARRLIGGLRPPVLDELGVAAAVRALVDEKQLATGTTIELHCDLRNRRFASPLETAVFRIIQESLNNALRYSRSDEVYVELAEVDSSLRIEVSDLGIGFDPGQVAGNHFGLQGIRHRARLFGGHAVIQTAPGQGTRILVDLPLVGNSASDPDAGP